jgi:hypothetical protein
VLEIARRSGEAFPYQDEREGEVQREEGARGDDQQAREMHWEYTLYARTYQNEGFANIPPMRMRPFQTPVIVKASFVLEWRRKPPHHGSVVDIES